MKVLFCKLMPTINPLVQILLAGTPHSLTAAACNVLKTQEGTCS